MLTAAWSLFLESAIYLLVGFLAAGLLEVVLSGARVFRFLAGRRLGSVFLATLVGVPLPLCSCSVLPAALTLRRKGASKGSTLSFLVSTPETSVTSVLLTWSLLGPIWAVFRPLAAALTAILAGLIETVLEVPFDRRPRRAEESSGESAAPAAEAPCDEPHLHGLEEVPAGTTASGRLRHGMRFAFRDLFDDILGWFIVGVLFAAALQVLVPPEVLASVVGGPLQSMLLMVLIGVPLYVCAEASTPIAAVLIAQGLNPGAALVFLLVGPATNLGSLGILRRELGLRTVAVYLTTIVVVALVMGAVLNDLLAGSVVAPQERALGATLFPYWLKLLGALVFLALAVQSARRRRFIERLAGRLDALAPFPVTRRGLGAGLAALALALWGLSGTFTVSPGEEGVVRRFGAVARAGLGPGLHFAWPWPVERPDAVPVARVQRTVVGFDPGRGLEAAIQDESWSLVGDENIADIKLAVHWGCDPGRVIEYQFAVAGREELVRSACLAAAREVLAGTPISDALTRRRAELEQHIADLAGGVLESYASGLSIHALQILDAHAPPEVHEAFRDVAGALEDRSTQIHAARGLEASDLPRARGEAAETIAEAHAWAASQVAAARGEAERFQRLAEVYAEHPDVTRTRLRIEALERVLPGLKKYIKPPDAEARELEIWLLESGTPTRPPDWSLGR